MDRVLTTLQEWVALYGLRIVGALAILLVGKWVSGALRRFFRRLVSTRRVDPTLATFGGNVVYMATMVFVVVAALSQLGVETTSFIAVLGTASLAVGLALQGSLANFAAGLLILVLRPFKVGDRIGAAGVAGTVEELQLLTTLLRTSENRVILVPNSKLMGDVIVNHSTSGTLRADLLATVPADKLDEFRALAEEMLAADARVLREPAPEVAVLSLVRAGAEVALRPWVRAEEFDQFSSDALEELCRRCLARGVALRGPSLSPPGR
jgi:small conductance mechanosensitive channel